MEEESRPKETITALWYDLITNIQARYEELEGTFDMVEVARLFVSTIMVRFTLGGLCR